MAATNHLNVLVRPEDTLRHVIQVIDSAAVQIALVVDEQTKLLGTVGVVSSHLMIIDPSYVEDCIDPLSVDWNDEEMTSGMTDEGKISTSGTGDGEYEVEGLVDEKGYIHQVIIKLI